MKQHILLLLLLLVGMTARAQKITVSGSVIDKETGEPVTAASVVLLNPDSTMASGVTSGLDGDFKLPAVRPGTYTLRISFVGYKTQTQKLTLTKKERQVDLGVVILSTDAILMREASATANAAKVEMKEDTFVYNASAYRLPEGSTLEELVKKLPGAEVDESGKITINGKEVKKIMVDGKEFFLNDTKIAMKNLPTNVVEKIKAYDRKSDYSRVTGIDDGEEETVLDLTVKKGMRDGWLINVDAAYGTEERYNGKVNISRFTDNLNFTIFGNANNVNDRGFGGGGPRGPWGGGGGGIVTTKSAGANIAWDNHKKQGEAGYFTLGGSVDYMHSTTVSETWTNSETFLMAGSRSASFSNSFSFSRPSSSRVNANMRVEWQPDSMTNIMFRPNYSWSENYGHSNSQSVTFSSNPYNKYASPLDSVFDSRTGLMRMATVQNDEALVNANIRSSMNSSYSHNVNGSLQLNRRLAKPGRNMTLDVNSGYNKSESESWSSNDIWYGNSKSSVYNRKYNPSPSTSWNVRGRVSYSEPIFSGANLQFSYSAQYRYSDSDRSQYELDSLISRGEVTQDELRELALGVSPNVEDWKQKAIDWENSQYATYKEVNHDASLMLRYKFGDFQLNGGVSFQPQTTHMDYAKNRIDTMITRNVFNWSPRVNLRWKISNASQLRLRYNGYSSQPSMTNLIEVYDNSDPLNISMGNAGLKPSWTHRGNLDYNNYIADRQMGWWMHADANTTMRSISNAVVYNERTGARYSRPMNIDGNWGTNLFVGFNTAMGSAKAFNVHTTTSVRHNNNVGYMSSNSDVNSNDINEVFANTNLLEMTTKRTIVGENLRFDWRKDFATGWNLELGLNGNMSYDHSRNDRQSNNNLDTWSFGYGGNALVYMPWGMQIATDITQESRRGYNDQSMNTNELIWNAQLSQSFLKDKSLTLTCQWYDILQQRSNISRAISATMRSDTRTNAINSYVMVHVIYKLNLMGNKQMRDQMRGFGNPGGFGGFGGPGGGPGGRPGGGGGRSMMRM